MLDAMASSSEKPPLQMRSIKWWEYVTRFPLISARKKQFKVPGKGEVGGMCTIVEEFAKEYAREEVAKAEAKAAKAAAGAAGEAVDRLMAALNMGAEQACEIIGITMNQYEEYKKQRP